MAGIEIQPIILSGGSGTRLWPLSREDHPKPLLLDVSRVAKLGWKARTSLQEGLARAYEDFRR